MPSIKHFYNRETPIHVTRGHPATPNTSEQRIFVFWSPPPTAASAACFACLLCGNTTRRLFRRSPFSDPNTGAGPRASRSTLCICSRFPFAQHSCVLLIRSFPSFQSLFSAIGSPGALFGRPDCQSSVWTELTSDQSVCFDMSFWTRPFVEAFFLAVGDWPPRFCILDQLAAELINNATSQAEGCVE